MIRIKKSFKIVMNFRIERQHFRFFYYFFFKFVSSSFFYSYSSMFLLSSYLLFSFFSYFVSFLREESISRNKREFKDPNFWRENKKISILQTRRIRSRKVCILLLIFSFHFSVFSSCNYLSDSPCLLFLFVIYSFLGLMKANCSLLNIMYHDII